MYTFTDALNSESLTLRPEATASTVRAAIEHSLVYDGPKRLWYAGPMYRHERPQKGRYREFTQFGAEAFGYPGPDVDAELIVMCAALWKELGLQGIRLELNTIGSSEERGRYRAELVRHLQAHESQLDADARRRLHSNPLRVLTRRTRWCGSGGWGRRAAEHPREESRAHFDRTAAAAGAAGVYTQVNRRWCAGSTTTT